MGDLRSAVQQYRSASLSRDGVRWTDGQLLESFILRREEAAFEALLQLHGAMVFAVCRRILGNHHDAEDAFQATFLVLARSAPSIIKRNSIASWLYGVANRVSLKAKESRHSRRLREESAAQSSDTSPAHQDGANDTNSILDEELSKLPAGYRDVLILCELEGKTYKEAAQRLNLTERAISMRLLRARNLLAKRLTRRGVIMSVGALSVFLTENVASASFPTALATSTCQAANSLIAGSACTVSPNVTNLIEGVLRTMFMTKVKIGITFAALLTTIGFGVGSLLLQVQAAPPQIGSNKQDAKQLANALGPKVDDAAAQQQEIAVIARKGFDVAFEAFRSVEYDDHEDICRWSLRWLEAETSVSRDQHQRLTAAESHLDRIKRFEEIIAKTRQFATSSKISELTVQYYRLDAERIVRRLK